MKVWNERSLLINTKARSLNILSQKSANEKQLTLEFYDIEYLGLLKDKKLYVMRLSTTSKIKESQKLRYQCVELGDQDEKKV